MRCGASLRFAGGTQSRAPVWRGKNGGPLFFLLPPATKSKTNLPKLAPANCVFVYNSTSVAYSSKLLPFPPLKQHGFGPVEAPGALLACHKKRFVCASEGAGREEGRKLSKLRWAGKLTAPSRFTCL